MSDTKKEQLEWVALYLSQHNELTTASLQSREFYNEQFKAIDTEVMPTRYIGHVQLKYIPAFKSEDSDVQA